MHSIKSFHEERDSDLNNLNTSIYELILEWSLMGNAYIVDTKKEGQKIFKEKTSMKQTFISLNLQFTRGQQLEAEEERVEEEEFERGVADQALLNIEMEATGPREIRLMGRIEFMYQNIIPTNFEFLQGEYKAIKEILLQLLTQDSNLNYFYSTSFFDITFMEGKVRILDEIDVIEEGSLALSFVNLIDRLASYYLEMLPLVEEYASHSADEFELVGIESKQKKHNLRRVETTANRIFRKIKLIHVIL